MDKMKVSDHEIMEEVIRRVSVFDIRDTIGSYPEPSICVNHRRAGILLPIQIKNGEIYLLLTKRSKDLRSHPSTVVFPGGMRDEGDETDIDAALREAEEEIGLPPSAVKVIGVLTFGVTLPCNIVCPVVGIIPEDFVPICNPSEVDYAFYMPLRTFVEEEGKVYLQYTRVNGKTYSFSDLNYTHDSHTERIFGFTCNYCVFLAAMVFGSGRDKEDLTVAKEMQDKLQLYFHNVTSGVMYDEGLSKL